MKRLRIEAALTFAACLLAMLLLSTHSSVWADDATGNSPDQFVPLDQKTADQSLQDLKARLNNPNLSSKDLTNNSALTHGIKMGGPIGIGDNNEIFHPIDPIATPIRVGPEPIHIFYPDVPVLPIKSLPPTQLQQISQDNSANISLLTAAHSNMQQQLAASRSPAETSSLKSSLQTINKTIQQLLNQQASIRFRLKGLPIRPLPPIRYPIRIGPCRSSLFVNGRWGGCRPEPVGGPVGPISTGPHTYTPIHTPISPPSDPFRPIDPNTDPSLHTQFNVR